MDLDRGFFLGSSSPIPLHVPGRATGGRTSLDATLSRAVCADDRLSVVDAPRCEAARRAPRALLDLLETVRSYRSLDTSRALLSRLASESTSAHSMRPQRLSSVAIWRTGFAGTPRTPSSFLQLAPSIVRFPAIDQRLDMQVFSSTSAVIGALVLGACGSPAELDEDSFPTLDKTGYGVTGAGAGSGTTDVTGGGNLGGSSSTPATGGSSGVASGGTQG